MKTPAGVRGLFATSLVGTWELFYRGDRTEAGESHPEPSLGENPIGLLVYDAGGRFSAQFMKRGRLEDDMAEASAGSSGHNNSRAVGGYDAYFGRYTVDEESHMVTQILEGALSAENVGVVVTRRMEVEGDQLMLRLPTTSVSGESIVRTLKWRRVA
jgi:hypothetical protein